MELLRTVVSSTPFLGAWAASAILGLGILIVDLRRANPEIPPLMRFVWLLTVAYSGLLGLAVYFFSGRKQIARDGLWRRGFRSVAHCYAGCGAGEILGVTVSVGLFAAGQWVVAGVTFACAYLFGLALTVGPLREEGVPWGTAIRDGVVSESASIVVMEAVAIGVDLWLAGGAAFGSRLFWGSLVVSLSMGLVAAYPVNVWLIARGVKEGMHDPREMAAHAA